MKYLFLIIFIIITQASKGQDFIEGWVVGEKPIQYAHILVKSTDKVILTDEKGYFRIEIDASWKSFSKDTLIVSALGFITKSLLVNDLLKTKRIFLEKKAHEIPELVVIDKKISTRSFLGATQKKKRATWGTCVKENIQVALFIKNEDQLDNTILENVSFFIAKRGVPTTPFRVRIYTVDTLTGHPSQDLLTENVILKATKGSEWVNINLSKYNILVPPRGLFVAMEWLYTNSDSQTEYFYNSNYDDNKKCFGQTIAMTYEFDEYLTWFKGEATQWIKVDYPTNNSKVKNIAISASVIR